MSDADDIRDPIDAAYLAAEAAQAGDDARAARRARVLAAVAADAAAHTSASAPGPARRVAWRPGGWLAAAGVAGLGGWLTLQLYRPTPARPSAPAAAAVRVQTAAPPALAPTDPHGAAAPNDSPPTATASTVVPPAREAVVIASPKTFPPEAAPLARSLGGQAEMAAGTTALKSNEAAFAADAARDEPLDAPAAAPPAMARAAALGLAAARSSAGASLKRRGDDWRRAIDAGLSASFAAAAAGRIGELEDLLAQGVAVDAPDEAGRTALMASIQANRPGAAAVLHRHGASLDRRNRAGVSARDLAIEKDDPTLNAALGLRP